MPFVAFLYLILALFCCLKGYSGQRVALGINKAVTRGQTDFGVRVGSKSFRSMICQSAIFVDRSMLLFEILPTSSRLVLLTAPNKWGKSVLLNMIKDFVEVEVDKTGRKLPYRDGFGYNIFKKASFEFLVDGPAVNLENPLLIANHSFLFSKYQAKYPVISIDFSGITANGFIEFVDKIKSTIHNVFTRYLFLKTFYEKNMNNRKLSDAQRMEYGLKHKTFTTIIDGNITGRDVEASLVFLCEALNRYLYREVVLCVDNYDAPINELLLKTNFVEKKRCLDFYDRLLSSTLNKNHFVKKTFVTGVLKYANRPFLAFAHEINFLDDKYAIFFGFGSPEVQGMLQFLQLSDKQSLLDHWYGGYHSRGPYPITYYNPWSVVNFLMPSYQLEQYWPMNFFVNVTVPDEIVGALCTMVSNNDYLFRPSDSLLVFDYELDRLFQKEENHKVNNMLKLLLLNGYLTVSYYHCDNVTLPLKIPNHEVSQYLISCLKDLLRTTLKLSDDINLGEYLQPFVYQLRHAATTEQWNSDELKEVIEKYLNEIPALQAKKFTGNVDSYIDFIKSVFRSMFNSVVIFFNDFQRPYFSLRDSLKPDAVLMYKNQGFAVEFKRTDKIPGQDMPGLAQQYSNYFKNINSSMKTMNYMELRFSVNRTVSVTTICHQIS